MFASNTSQVSSDAVYVEDVFSTYLYTGNGSSQTITNGIDLAGKGGLFWVKARAVAGSHGLMYGSGTELCSHSTNGLPASQPYTFDASGITFTGGSWTGFSSPNESGRIYTSWTFRKQPKFFDVVTFTTDSSGNATVSHSLASTPGCILIKKTSGSQDWKVYHRSLNDPTNRYLELNSTSSEITAPSQWITVSSTQISFPGNRLDGSSNYVAYLFAHDAGGFGTAGTDNVISCGSLTCGSTGTYSVNLGWEPQFILIKRSDTTGSWWVCDNMRNLPATQYAAGGTGANALFANTADTEFSNYAPINITPTGFEFYGGSRTDIYIAIRRGPMKTPTSGTSVFTPTTYTGNGSSQTITTTIRPDFVLLNWITGGISETFDRLRGNELLYTQANASKDSSNQYISFANNTGFVLPSSTSYTNASSNSYTPEAFTRAPSVIDVVCYTGTGSIRTVSHNLTVAPEMMWVKRRDTTGAWSVYHQAVGNTKWANLSATSVPATSSNYWNNTTPTASVFTVGATGDVNASGGTYVAYLFATCPGVSKVGSYTGNGTNQTINCGFSSGARLIMIKRTDAVGSWYLWDSSRGIVSGNDPYIRLNDGAVSTTTDAVDADNSGFIVNQESLNLNVNAATYIFWAVA